MFFFIFQSFRTFINYIYRDTNEKFGLPLKVIYLRYNKISQLKKFKLPFLSPIVFTYFIKSSYGKKKVSFVLCNLSIPSAKILIKVAG